MQWNDISLIGDTTYISFNLNFILAIENLRSERERLLSSTPLSSINGKNPVVVYLINTS
jgi:hypothetical protein